MYGEGWTGGHSPLANHKKALKGSMHQMPGIAAFNDDTLMELKEMFLTKVTADSLTVLTGRKKA